jgi:GNAT superfamily N-acetyltransferase
MESESVVVRGLRPEDFDAVVDLDAKVMGRRREEYFRMKLQQALTESGIGVSLAAEVDGQFAGFCLARVFYGEFGALEKAAVLDTVGVHPDLWGRGVGRALLGQLRTNLLGLGIPKVHTEVSWDEPELMTFFQHAGFRPASRVALDLDLAAARRREETADA